MEARTDPVESLALVPSMRLAMAMACAHHVVLVAIVLCCGVGRHPPILGAQPPHAADPTTTAASTLATKPTRLRCLTTFPWRDQLGLA